MTENTPHIFPTRTRDKHSQLLSYPLGAEALSRALDGTPQHLLFSCQFWAGNPHRVEAQELVRVLTVRYWQRARSFYDGKDAAERGVFEPRWEIVVSAVPRTMRHAIKTQLLHSTLPQFIHPWLLAVANVTGRTGELVFQVHYDPVDSIIVCGQLGQLPPDLT